MVSQEEYEYASFKCAFCRTLNPAKKLRPIAPRISGQNIICNEVPLPTKIAATDTESSSKSSPERSKHSDTCNPFESGSDSDVNGDETKLSELKKDK